VCDRLNKQLCPLTETGAYVTIFARKQKLLDEAKAEIIAARQDESQKITAVAADMAVASKVSSNSSFRVTNRLTERIGSRRP
jgi:hypothetical protein